jgi:hypothetical protein
MFKCTGCLESFTSIVVLCRYRVAGLLAVVLRVRFLYGEYHRSWAVAS